MSALSVAIIGAGNIAGNYDEKKQAGASGVYSHAGAYSAHGGFKLSTVYDLDVKKAEDFSRTWGISRSLAELSELYQMRHDVISVCTPDETHVKIVKDILLSGCCATIFVEKPLAMDAAEVDDLIELADHSGINVVVNFQRRTDCLSSWNPAFGKRALHERFAACRHYHG
jgi:predicted dehydrogenase